MAEQLMAVRQHPIQFADIIVYHFSFFHVFIFGPWALMFSSFLLLAWLSPPLFLVRMFHIE
jgi:hypothetical protein